MDEGKANKAKDDREEIYSKAVRAGKRTYFFDVKTTRGNDLYLTITESKKKFGSEGKFFFEKHKLFLYKEDFEKFEEGFQDCIQKIQELRQNGKYKIAHENGASANAEADSYSDVSFEDLGSQD